ncbi:MAG TPA: hypothetical protein VLH13_03200 [Methanomassiliicoccales archaeon]|nr:hypothetical protein [Methanomassiliicoccales archaeon]
MVEIPVEVMKVINDPKAVKVITTVSANGVLHSIRAGSIIAPAPNMIAVGAILMKTTAKNIENMKKHDQQVAVLVGSEMTSYLIMAKIADGHKSGPLFDGMNEELKKMGLQAREVLTFVPTGVWNQSANYDAGKKMV